ncbi:amidohydrolase family protein [Microbacterium sp. CFBP9034]|uniref:amidohydrolase family protein n=1 Tax=Microbacterium sp. CFBP9034 TaxID=3096540 RepID=UPI002A69BC32|nr:amidohydrolase family protein [Microbacterium sp. CFBP9034]MDY0909694.1 amidohydrolase family protein [Microbacterium sp. CFBP9034]
MSTTILRGGRVIDPAARTATIADVVVRAGRVESVSTEHVSIADATIVDVTGMIIGPGFVDLHSHVHSIAGQRLQAFDGVTTTLDLEAGLMPIDVAYAEAAAAGRVLNYGFSASWADARGQVLAGVTPTAQFHDSAALLGIAEWQRSSSPRELSAWLRLLEGELSAGALGIGVLLGYAPRSDPAEYLAVARLAARAGAPTFTHVREIVELDPTTPVDGSREVTIAAAETGAAMHHCHVNSTSRRHVDRVLENLESARSAGSRVTLEAYPYGMGATSVGAAFLAPDRLRATGLSPSSIVMLGSGERIADERRLAEVRALDPAATCFVEFLDERDEADRARLRRALAFPDSIVASDAMPVEWEDGRTDTREWPLPAGASTHPRTAGTFARSLRLMVREHGMWDWVEAFRRCSYLPARVLDEVAPAMRAKGRLEAGSDADLVVIDPAALTDNATAADPVRVSSGVRHLVVGGTFVIRNGELDQSAYSGRAVRGEPR